MPKFDPSKELEIEKILYSFLDQENFSGSFEKIRTVFENFNTSFKNSHLKIITIAGTNGKGETCLNLKELLEKKGFRVGVFTSPHILSITERFYFHGDNLSYLVLKELIIKACSHLKETKLSFYEFLFYLFCLHAEKEKETIDYLILEVGLGGAKDTVNLLTPDLCAITSISRDHQDILGNRFSQILFEKLGIIRAKTPLFTCFKLRYLDQLAEAFCLANDTPRYNISNMIPDKDKNNFSIRNQYMAIALSHWLEHSNLDSFDSNLIPKIFSTQVGRFELMTLGKIRFIFIGAHNIDGIRMLEKTLESQMNEKGINLPLDEFWVSFSHRDLKDINAAIRILKNQSWSYKKLWLTSFEHIKSLKLNADVIKLLNTELPDQMIWKDRLTIMDRDVNKTVAITGSYYFIGEVQKELLSLK